MKEYEQDVVHLIPLESIHVLNPRAASPAVPALNGSRSPAAALKAI